MKSHCIIIILSITNLIFANNNYNSSAHLCYKPFEQSSIINLHIAFYKSHPSIGVQWWVSDNLEISGMLSHSSDDIFQSYNNFSLGYYNSNVTWFYSDSNLIELSLHKVKYTNLHYKQINCAYKSRYNYGDFILGYDLNYYFWGQNNNKFISLLINYNFNKKIILELKSDIKDNNIFGSFNISIPL